MGAKPITEMHLLYNGIKISDCSHTKRPPSARRRSFHIVEGAELLEIKVSRVLSNVHTIGATY